ncbi:hypothetical protein EPUS_07124 [Endocarpon pusillum Z07020]|uniref:Uncharacterized protein n=1 Tax=Endocarpon pusillum (strain Z07020 / HMAS-L-300199) TaxID=1263415 RepID=U1HRA9_ENDPU|nr:uncharacterized protein EPUS_07124 [Endocarpon pusillum Z07020]ERF73030.1 hypothetical protein EPUS_07124 [Endocarpon pusillum Z07020]
MPYGALRSSHARAIDYSSPSGPAVSASPPSDVLVKTPGADTAFRPAADSPSDSRLSKALKVRHAVERARHFVQGRHHELVKSMNKLERVIMTTWLYQYWQFSPITAKYWGKGPRNWTAGTP